MEPLGAEARAIMARLEEADRRDRTDGTPDALRLRAITPDVGRFLHTLVLATNARTIVECGTSVGYSTLWFATAAQLTSGQVVTFEIDPRKVERARETFSEANVWDVVDLREGDAVDGLAQFDGTADLVFVDTEKDSYDPFLEPAVRALRPGGLLAADNLTSHAEYLAAFRNAALAHPQLSGLVVPIGRGVLTAVKTVPEAASSD